MGLTYITRQHINMADSVVRLTAQRNVGSAPPRYMESGTVGGSRPLEPLVPSHRPQSFRQDQCTVIPFMRRWHLVSTPCVLRSTPFSKAQFPNFICVPRGTPESTCGCRHLRPHLRSDFSGASFVS